MDEQHQVNTPQLQRHNGETLIPSLGRTRQTKQGKSTGERENQFLCESLGATGRWSCGMWSMQALAKGRREVAASTNSGKGPGRVCWSLGCKTCFYFFFISSGDRESCEAEIKRRRKSNLKKKKGLKTIYLEVTYPFSRSEKYQLNLHSYGNCLNKSKTFN